VLRVVPAVIVVVLVLFAGMWLGGHSDVLPDAVQDLVTDDEVATEAAELTRLRREVKRLEQENEILKRAAAFFAREAVPS